MAKRLKASERRATILAVAKVLFSDRGYHGVSVDDIARRLGVSPAILYRHFPSKEALYESVLNEIELAAEPEPAEAVPRTRGGRREPVRARAAAVRRGRVPSRHPRRCRPRRRSSGNQVTTIKASGLTEKTSVSVPTWLVAVFVLVPLAAVFRMHVNRFLDGIPVLERNIEHSNEQHRAIVLAVLAGDPEGAAADLEEHLAGSAALLRGFLG